MLPSGPAERKGERESERDLSQVSSIYETHIGLAILVPFQAHMR